MYRKNNLKKMWSERRKRRKRKNTHTHTHAHAHTHTHTHTHKQQQLRKWRQGTVPMKQCYSKTREVPVCDTEWRLHAQCAAGYFYTLHLRPVSKHFIYVPFLYTSCTSCSSVGTSPHFYSCWCNKCNVSFSLCAKPGYIMCTICHSDTTCH